MAEAGSTSARTKTPGERLLRDPIRVLYWWENKLLEGETEAGEMAEKVAERAGPTRMAQLTSRGTVETTVKREIVNRMLKNGRKFFYTAPAQTSTADNSMESQETQPPTEERTAQDATRENDSRVADVRNAGKAREETPEQSLVGPVGRKPEGRTDEQAQEQEGWTLAGTDRRLALFGLEGPSPTTPTPGPGANRRALSQWVDSIVVRSRPQGWESDDSDEESARTAIPSSSPEPRTERPRLGPNPWSRNWNTGGQTGMVKPRGEPSGMLFGKHWDPRAPSMDATMVEAGPFRSGEEAARAASDEFGRRRIDCARSTGQRSTMSWAAESTSPNRANNTPHPFTPAYQPPTSQSFHPSHQLTQFTYDEFCEHFRLARTPREAQMSNAGDENGQTPSPAEELAVLNVQFNEMRDMFTRMANQLETAHLARQGGNDRAEYVKPEMVGLVNPIPAHQEWNGEPTDDKGTYISFNAWLDHLEAVLSPKTTPQYKQAVMDTAILQCLKGHALAWWNALSPEQKLNLRRDFTLQQWRGLGAKLTRRCHTGRNDALARKRRVGETLVQYAYAKNEMLRDAFENISTQDTVDYIRDGLSTNDQLLVRSTLAGRPTVQNLLDELSRIDQIRAQDFRTITRSKMQSARPTYPTSQYASRDTQAFGQSFGQNSKPSPKAARTPVKFDAGKIKMRVNPFDKNGQLVRSYEFNDGKVIYLNRPCRHCGASGHFSFECPKAPARAAPMEVEDYEEPEDEVKFYLLGSVHDDYEEPTGLSLGSEEDWSAHDNGEGAWDEWMDGFLSGN